MQISLHSPVEVFNIIQWHNYSLGDSGASGRSNLKLQWRRSKVDVTYLDYLMACWNMIALIKHKGLKIVVIIA
jgi:hypothetical protein